MGRIELNGMRFRAFHGCCESEKILGNTFIADFWCEYDSSAAQESDRVEDAVDYSIIYDIIKAEMAVRSNLLENLCSRIISTVMAGFPSLIHCGVKVSKMNPPLAGSVFSSSFYLEK